MNIRALGALVLLAGVLPAVAAEKPTQAEHEKQFIDTLTGATLTGSFTVTGNTPDAGKGLKTEKYTIDSVSKLQDNLFLFKTRIQYGANDVSVPIPLVVLWAGDTPVITLTDAAITPSGKKYTARVMIYRDHYAGFWSSPDHGGHLFGTITREKK
jgi:hypothetical protein